jgi:hypothetical protein
MEIWKDITGYEGLYQVSNTGKVKSLEKLVQFGKQKRVVKEKELSQTFNGPYLKVSLFSNNKGKTYRVHQLVAMAFLGHIPNGKDGITVDHIDRNKLNNSVDNLRLIHNRVNGSLNREKLTSKYIGVYWSKQYKKWVSAIRIKGVKHILGMFDCELKAAYTYNKKVKEVCNEIYF